MACVILCIGLADTVRTLGLRGVVAVPPPAASIFDVNPWRSTTSISLFPRKKQEKGFDEYLHENGMASPSRNSCTWSVGARVGHAVEHQCRLRQVVARKREKKKRKTLHLAFHHFGRESAPLPAGLPDEVRPFSEQFWMRGKVAIPQLRFSCVQQFIISSTAMVKEKGKE